MKKKLITLILVVVMALSTGALAGCSMITVDTERNINQVVATVKTGDRVDYIYKKELMSMYATQGYLYIQGYQMEPEAVVEMFLNQLINKQIILQQAEKILPLENHDASGIESMYVKYLTVNEINTVKDTVHKAVNELIDSYQYDILGIEQTTPDTTNTRVKPTFEEEDEEEEIINAEDITVIDIDSTSTRKEAYNKMVKTLESNYTDYDKFLQEQYAEEAENIVIEKWRQSIENSVSITDQEIIDRYNSMLADQQETYLQDMSAFDEKLDNLSSSDFLLYSPKSGYGFVYNIVLSFSDYQSAVLSNFTSDYNDNKISKEEYLAARQDLLDKIVIKDLRESWITAEYDFDPATRQFGTDLVKNNEVLTFGADVVFTYENEEGEEVKIVNGAVDKFLEGEYTFENYTEYNIDEFMAKFDEWMSSTTVKTSGEFYATGKINEGVSLEEAMAMFKDLMFAYSGDDSDTALNTYLGYVSEPAPSDNASEDFVKEFADAARYAVEQGEGSYVVVGTDYGYHIVYCTKKIDEGILETLVLSEMNTEGTFSYKFKQSVLDSLKSKVLSETQTATLNKFNDMEGVVTRYPSRYKDIYD